jgi:preprotein translocase subunit SecB
MTTNLELAGTVARNVDLDSINLRHAKLEAGIEPSEMPEEVSADIQYRTSIDKRSSKYIPSGIELAVNIELRLQVKGRVGDESVQVLFLEAGYLLIYTPKTGATFEDSCLKHFSEINGPYNAWPYWRELVQSVTGRIGLPGLTVPVFRPSAVEVGQAAGEQSGEGKGSE